MKNNELIDRYVYAVVKQLPEKMRADIDKELRSLISDMLEERCGDVEPTERDVNVVLAELGKPSELAARYDPDGERSLIGPRYFRKYIYVMKIVLHCVAFGVALSAIVSSFVDPSDKHWLLQVGEWVSTIITSVICSAAIVTAIFAIFEWKGVTLDEDDLSKLPSVPKKEERISKGECIFGIIFSVVALVVLCFAPEICCVISVKDGITVSTVQLFNVEVMRSLWPLWSVCFLLGVSREIFRLCEGVYTKRLAIFTTVANIASGAVVLIALLRNNIINEGFGGYINEMITEQKDAQFINGLFTNFNIFLAAVICFALVLDTVTTIVKTAKYANSNK